jgi:hypothetical protein
MRYGIKNILYNVYTNVYVCVTIGKYLTHRFQLCHTPPFSLLSRTPFFHSHTTTVSSLPSAQVLVPSSFLTNLLCSFIQLQLFPFWFLTVNFLNHQVKAENEYFRFVRNSHMRGFLTHLESIFRNEEVILLG